MRDVTDLDRELRECLDMLECVRETDGELHRGGLAKLRRVLERVVEEREGMEHAHDRCA